MEDIRQLRVTKVLRDEDTVKIFLAFWFPSDINTENKGWRERAGLGIDHKRMRLIPQWSTDWLYRAPHRHPWSSPLMLLMIPLSLPVIGYLFGWLLVGLRYATWPIHYPLGKLFEAIKYRSGLTPMHRQLLGELRGKLDAGTFDLLKATLRNEHRINTYLSARPSYEEARNLLGSCDLRVTTIDKKDSYTKLDAVLDWFNEEDVRVAEAQRVDGHWHIFQVLGVNYCHALEDNPPTKAQLDQLAGVFRSMTTESWEEHSKKYGFKPVALQPPE